MTVGGAPAVVALVLVSHSRALAEGAVELAAQMAPGVLLVAAGGAPDGGLGTSFDRVEEALTQALADGRGAVVLTDLGSAVLTTESVLDLADPDDAARVRIADAPFVEGAVAAAVTAHAGADVDTVLAAAEHAGTTFASDAAPPGPPSRGAAPSTSQPAALSGDVPPPSGAPASTTVPAADEDVVRGTVVLRNPLGLHARPAAVVARMLAGYDAQVLVDGVNAASVLELMKLGAGQGHRLTVEARGPQAAEARDALVEAVEGGFGEV